MLLKSALSSIHEIQGDRFACRKSTQHTPNCAHTNALKIHSKPHQIHETHTQNVLFRNACDPLNSSELGNCLERQRKRKVIDKIDALRAALTIFVFNQLENGKFRRRSNPFNNNKVETSIRMQ